MSTETANKTVFKNITEIKRANKEAGHYFFSPDTMRFFESQIVPEVFGPRGRFFILSDKAGFTDETREYKIKWANGDGTIENVEHRDFEGNVRESWPSLPEAREVLRGNLRWAMEDTDRIEVFYDPYDENKPEAEAPEDNYYWRMKIGLLLIGVRDTKAGVARTIEEGFEP